LTKAHFVYIGLKWPFLVAHREADLCEIAYNIVGFFQMHSFVFLSSRHGLRTGCVAFTTRITAFVKKVSYNA